MLSVISSTLVGGVLPFCRDAPTVIYSSCQQGQQDPLVGGEFYSSADRQSTLSTAQADWAIEHSLGSFTPMQSVYSRAQAAWATKTLVGGVLLLCKPAVRVIYSSSQLGCRTLAGEILLFCSRLGHRKILGRILSLCRDGGVIIFLSSQ